MVESQPVGDGNADYKFVNALGEEKWNSIPLGIEIRELAAMLGRKLGRIPSRWELKHSNRCSSVGFFIVEFHPVGN